MKLVTWNVNGLRACMKKGFSSYFETVNADIFCIQETKMKKVQATFTFPNYYEYWFEANKPGYSGTLVYTKIKPMNVNYGIDNALYLDEGRVITLEYPEFYLVNVYVPNAKRDLSRLSYRIRFDEKLRNYLVDLKSHKNVIVCGDFNVAHQEIDIANPKSNQKNAGFTKEERENFTKLLSSGFIDVFRKLNSDEIKYTWWNYMFTSRQRNIGWRIDYFLVNKEMFTQNTKIEIHTDIFGSDHCPVVLEVD